MGYVITYLIIILQFWHENWAYAIPFIILAIAAIVFRAEAKKSDQKLAEREPW
jgi:hypothetical protein